MASGGGSHPSHLPITSPSSHNRASQSSSLQTPDTSSLFISALKGVGSGGSGSGFSPSPSLEHSQSFTSLEELLNVTGINSLELDQSRKSVGHDHGVNSLQRIAREVENSQGSIEPPPSKRLCVNNTPHQTLNDRVQPLHSPPTTTSPTTRLPQTVPPSSQHLTMPIVSLLNNKRNFTTTSNLNSTTSPVPSVHKQFLSDSNTSNSNLPPPPPYTINATSSISGPTGLTSSTSLNIFNRATSQDRFPSLQSSSQTQLQSTDLSGRQPLPSILSQSSLPSLTSMAPTSASQNQGLTRTVDNVNSNSKSVVFQLIQLYKQYQGLNDQQGMMRVRDQLNLLVSAQQKILAAQNNLIKPDGGGGSSVLAGEPGTQLSGQQISSLPKTASVGQANMSGGNTDRGQGISQQRASRILSQLAMVSSKSQQSGGVSVPWSSGDMTTSLPAYNGLPPPYSGAPLPPVTNVTPPPPPAYIETSSITTSLAPSATHITGSTPNMPPSLLSHMGGSSTPPTTSSQNHVLDTSQADTQKAVKQIQMLMTALPDSKRPKTIQELKEFVQKYSTLVSKGTNNRTLPKSTTLPLNNPLNAGPQFVSTAINSGVNSTAESQSSLPPSQISSLPARNTSQTPAAHVAEHFRNSLMSSTKQVSQVPSQETSAKASQLVSSSSSGGPSRTALPTGDTMKLHHHHHHHHHHQSNSNTCHAPVTDQFKQPGNLITTAPSPAQVESVGKQNPAVSMSSQSTSMGIQAGVATPLPPGLTLETLGVLCRLPESDLLKLKLPHTLLSAIKVWKARQIPGSRSKVTSGKNNIPVLIPPPASEFSVTSNSSSIVNLTKPSYHGGPGLGVGMMGQPNVIPSGAGFPPRSLHAYVPGSTANMSTLTSRQTQVNTNSQQHMTRYKVKMEQQKIKTERLQALQKALQSSEEARIAYRFSAHLEKMHSQLLNPDTVSSFRSHHDVLARLLPYHLYAEPEPPSAAVDKADAVFESVAQVLLSRSRGLKSRFEQAMIKIENEGGSDQREMKFHLDRLFLEGERERIQKEDLEKKEAEQIAADLSLMADNVYSFDSDFSFGDVFDPMMSMDSGIT